MFQVTGSAYQKLQEIIQREQKSPDEKLYIRLTMGIGWGGPELKLSLEEQPLTADQQYTFENLLILIHPNDYVYFHQTKLDYVKDVFGNGNYKLLKM